MKKNLLLFVLILATILGASPAHAERTWLQMLFPTLRDSEPDPSQTLKAPFAEGAPAPGAPVTAGPPPKTSLPENSEPLDFPHRNSNQIGEWAMMAASDALTFDKADYRDSLNANLKHFSENGKKEYMAFLQENKIIDILSSGKYKIRSFVREKPLLLNQGAVEGRYRWLYEVPVMVSYMDSGMKGYKDAPTPVSQTMTLTIQIGRTTDLTPGNDVIVENWSGKIESAPATPAPQQTQDDLSQ